MSRLGELLSQAQVYFLATTDNGQPKIRPIGPHYEMDGKILFGIGAYKDVYRQLTQDPRAEIAAYLPDGHWLRYSGRAVFETDPECVAAVVAGLHLEDVINDETGKKLAVFHLEDASAKYISVTEETVDLI